MNDKLREAAQQALEALEEATTYTSSPSWSPSMTNECNASITALRAALTTLAAAVAEPVAMRYDFDGYGYRYIDNGSGSDWQARHKDAEPLYAAPATPSQRKPLTEEQCVSIFREAFLASPDPLVKDNMTIAFARAIERAHGIGDKDD